MIQTKWSKLEVPFNAVMAVGSIQTPEQMGFALSVIRIA